MYLELPSYLLSSHTTDRIQCITVHHNHVLGIITIQALQPFRLPIRFRSNQRQLIRDSTTALFHLLQRCTRRQSQRAPQLRVCPSSNHTDHHCPPTSLEHKPPSVVQFSPPISTVASFEIIKATKEQLVTDKPTLKRLSIPASLTDQIEKIQPFTPGYTDKVKGWSTSCRNSPVVETTPRAAKHDRVEKQESNQVTQEKTNASQPAQRDSFRPRTLSTHQADPEALTQLQDVRNGDQSLLVIMDQTAQEARRARHRDGSCDRNALKLQGFLTT